METTLTFMSTGLCAGCEVCRQNHRYQSLDDFDVDISSGVVCDEPSFSWQPCELCGSTLGGDRYSGHGREPNDNIVHVEICLDCLQSLG